MVRKRFNTACVLMEFKSLKGLHRGEKGAEINKPYSNEVLHQQKAETHFYD